MKYGRLKLQKFVEDLLLILFSEDGYLKKRMIDQLNGRAKNGVVIGIGGAYECCKI
jgi:hypothetical protein